MDLILYWLLPSLITMLTILQMVRRIEIKNLENFGQEEWLTILILSILYPIGLVMVLSVLTENNFNFLVKEINQPRKQK